MKLGEIDISQIEFDMRSRDEIPKLLMGPQHIWCTPELRQKVFTILDKLVPEGLNPNTGKPGMELWKILALGTLRLNCNWDYDKVMEMANEHKTLRQMMGHAIFYNDYKCKLQTIRDNVALLTPEVLDEINPLVVNAGHNLVKKNSEASLNGKCDSFVVKTNVHHPTDINLLLDAIRKVIQSTAQVCFTYGFVGWRQSTHNLKKIKRLYRRAQNLKHSTSKNESKQAERVTVVKQAYAAYVEVVESFVLRAKDTVLQLRQQGCSAVITLLVIDDYIQHAERQIDQVRRRVLNDEVIPHDEKVFSVFEQHTE